MLGFKVRLPSDEVLTKVVPGLDAETAETPVVGSDLPDRLESERSSPTVARPLGKPTNVGDVVDGKYRLVHALGRGGMGRIFAADHLMLGTKVALKFMHPHLARDRVQVARFSREARAAALLKSEHVARIMDVGQLPNGELFIVMEYLDGISLEKLAGERHGLAIADALTYLAQACDALAEAHAREILHRDVKPANMLLTQGTSGEPVIKVLDFGLAKMMASNDSFSIGTSAASRVALGTPYYMSPEQIMGQAVDARSDIWALGATLYELLTGELAFPGVTAGVVFQRVLKSRPAPLAQLRPDAPPGVLAIVDRCLEHDPNARFQSARELARALESSLAGLADTEGFEATTERMEAAPPSAQPSETHVLFAPHSVRATMPMAAPVETIRTAMMAAHQPPPSVRPPPSLAAGPPPRRPLFPLIAAPLLVVIVAAMIAVVMTRHPKPVHLEPPPTAPAKK